MTYDPTPVETLGGADKVPVVDDEIRELLRRLVAIGEAVLAHLEIVTTEEITPTEQE